MGGLVIPKWGCEAAPVVKPLHYLRNIPLPTASLFPSFSTRRKSARLRVEQILNPYPAHYRLAFAFSGVLCRQTHWRPLRLAVSGNQRGLPVYHVSYQHRYGWVRFRLFAGDATSATGDFIAPVPDPLPFWFKPVSIFGLLRVTTFNSGSHMLTIPPHPCSQPP